MGRGARLAFDARLSLAVRSVKVRNGPSPLAQHDPLAEHAATDQMLA